MASVWRHPKSPYWSACIRLPDGKRTKRTTKETDRKKAQEQANKWEAASQGHLTAIQARRVITDIYKAKTGESLGHFSSRTFLENWLKIKKPEIDDTTFEKYAATVSEFLAYLGDGADGDLLRLTTDTIQEFRTRCAEVSSPKTANNKLVVIKQALKAAWMDG